MYIHQLYTKTMSGIKSKYMYKNRMSSSCISIETQFRRCMDQHLGLPISDEEYEFLLRKYDAKSNGMINYCSFVDTMENGKLICSIIYIMCVHVV